MLIWLVSFCFLALGLWLFLLSGFRIEHGFIGAFCFLALGVGIVSKSLFFCFLALGLGIVSKSLVVVLSSGFRIGHPNHSFVVFWL